MGMRTLFGDAPKLASKEFVTKADSGGGQPLVAGPGHRSVELYPSDLVLHVDGVGGRAQDQGGAPVTKGC